MTRYYSIIYVGLYLLLLLLLGCDDATRCIADGGFAIGVSGFGAEDFSAAVAHRRFACRIGGRVFEDSSRGITFLGAVGAGRFFGIKNFAV